MASIGNDRNGCKRILFVVPDGKRKSIRLDKMTKKQAQGVKLHVERLVSATLSDQPVPDDTSRWLVTIDDTLAG